MKQLENGLFDVSDQKPRASRYTLEYLIQLISSYSPEVTKKGVNAQLFETVLCLANEINALKIELNNLKNKIDER